MKELIIKNILKRVRLRWSENRGAFYFNFKNISGNSEMFFLLNNVEWTNNTCISLHNTCASLHNTCASLNNPVQAYITPVQAYMVPVQA